MGETVKLIELLFSLEWSGTEITEVSKYPEDGYTENPVCPICRGWKDNYWDPRISPIPPKRNKGAIIPGGHKKDCALRDAIEEQIAQELKAAIDEARSKQTDRSWIEADLVTRIG